MLNKFDVGGHAGENFKGKIKCSVWVRYYAEGISVLVLP